MHLLQLEYVIAQTLEKKMYFTIFYESPRA